MTHYFYGKYPLKVDCDYCPRKFWIKAKFRIWLKCLISKSYKYSHTFVCKNCLKAINTNVEKTSETLRKKNDN